MVLDLLGLVEHQPTPVLGGELVALEPQEGVGRHHDVVVACDGRHVVRAATHHPDAQPGGVGHRLLSPRGDHARGSHDEERVDRAACCSVLDQREHLEGLAQPHVVGKDPAQSVLVQEREPPEALELVGPEPGLDPLRLGLGHLGEVTQGGGALHPGCGLGVDHAQLVELGPGAEVARADAHPARSCLAELCRQRHHLLQAGELGPLEGDVETAGQDEELVAPGQGGQHVGQRDQLAVDAHVDLEVEPVGVVGLLVGERERDLRGGERLPEVRSLALRDVEVTQLPQVGQVVEGQGQGVAASDLADRGQRRGHPVHDPGLDLRVAHPAEGVGRVERTPGRAVGPVPGEGCVGGGVPGDQESEPGPRGGRHLHGAVGRADPQAPAQRRQGLQERVEVLAAHHDRRTEEQVEETVVQRLRQVGEEHVVVVDQDQARGGPTDRRDLLAAPATLRHLGDDLEHELVSVCGQVGTDPDRPGAQREGADACSRHQGDPGPHGCPQGRDEPVAVVVEGGRRPGHEIGVQPHQPAVEGLEGVDLGRHEPAAGRGTGEVRPLGAAAHPPLARARTHRTHGEVAGGSSRPAGRRTPGDLQGERRPFEAGTRALTEVVVDPGQPLTPHRTGRGTWRAPEPERHGSSVLAQPRHRAGAGAEDPVRGLGHLRVELHVVGHRGRAAHLRCGGQAARRLVDDLEVDHVHQVTPGARHRRRVVELGEVVVVESVTDVHEVVIVAPTTDIGPPSSTGGLTPRRVPPGARLRAPTGRRRRRGWRGGRG